MLGRTDPRRPLSGPGWDAREDLPDSPGFSRMFPGCSRRLPGCSRSIRVASQVPPGCSRIPPGCSRRLPDSPGCSRVAPGRFPGCPRGIRVARHRAPQVPPGCSREVPGRFRELSGGFLGGFTESRDVPREVRVPFFAKFRGCLPGKVAESGEFSPIFITFRLQDTYRILMEILLKY